MEGIIIPEVGQWHKDTQGRSFGQCNLLQGCFLGKIHGQTITGSNVKYMEHSCPLLCRLEEKQDPILVQNCYSR